MDKNIIFALDIGTRKIAGLVMKKDAGGCQLLDYAIQEHPTRAMLDGQIHDVEEVAKTIKSIKKTLEDRLKKPLKSAAVAAAGRSLKTARGSSRKQRFSHHEITREEVMALEVEAIQEAQYVLAREEAAIGDKSNYFCVGYSIIAYQLENQKIGNLVGQVGTEIETEVIATFLPRVVIDSLFSVLKRAGLEIYSLTLEPIAALSVTIPASMRLLNLALVDIGAGTSDIALVRSGTISAYAMVPCGGDEMTEYLASHYLLDFNVAEQLKRALLDQETIMVCDILGNNLKLISAEVKQVLQPVTQQLARSIGGNILELNGEAPDAILCVGGGSLTPSLITNIAEAINIAPNRVGTRTPPDFIQIQMGTNYPEGPEGVTPLGIAYHSCTIPPVPFIRVIVNGRELALWNMGELTVAAALLSSGISLTNIYGKPGLGKTVEINGYVKVFRGEMGTPPVIKVNEQDASLETVIHDGDQIEFHPGSDGQEARILVKELVPGAQGKVWVNGESLDLYPVVKVNGVIARPDDEVPDRARVEFRRANSLENILALAGIPASMLQARSFNYYLNGQGNVLQWSPLKIMVNGENAASPEVDFGARVEYSIGSLRPRIRDVLADQQMANIVVMVNGEEIKLPGSSIGIIVNGQPAGLDEELMEGAKLIIDQKSNQAILSDIFKVVDVKPGSTGKLVMQVDGKEAGFTTPINSGSEITLKWEE
ncbi:cell division protein FtsA [Syntrophomonas erecta]